MRWDARDKEPVKSSGGNPVGSQGEQFAASDTADPCSRAYLTLQGRDDDKEGFFRFWWGYLKGSFTVKSLFTKLLYVVKFGLKSL